MGIEELGANFVELLTKWGASQDQAEIINSSLIVLGIIIVSILANWITKRLIIRLVSKIIKRSKNVYDDIFLEKKVFNNLSHIVPAIIIYYTIEFAFKNPDIISAVKTFSFIYMIIIIIVVIISFLDALDEVYQKLGESKIKGLDKSSDEYAEAQERLTTITGYVKIIKQVVKILFLVIGIILVFSQLLGQSPGKILTGLGALAAVIMLVFKDTILGFVASIQLSAYKMLKRGDWISMPSRGADGTVIDISLSTVKVQNFDKTISTIPTYALVSESFKNWDGMQKSKGRRIKRAVKLDMKTVKFCTPEMLDKFRKIKVLQEYIQQKEEEITKYNTEMGIDDSVKVNGRRLTNLGTFRKYLELYLRNNPNIRNDYTFLVRQLSPDESGVAIEVYFFTNTTAWGEYEAIQADIFDHILAVIPEFELAIFQNPTGHDFRAAFEKVLTN